MNIKVADQAWVATAMLHSENPQKTDFSLQEIRRRAEREFGDLRPGVWQHIVSHGVAQNPPTPVRVRLLTQTDRGRRRLFRAGDPFDKARDRTKVHPELGDLPPRYRPL